MMKIRSRPDNFTLSTGIAESVLIKGASSFLGLFCTYHYLAETMDCFLISRDALISRVNLQSDYIVYYVGEHVKVHRIQSICELEALSYSC